MRRLDRQLADLNDGLLEMGEMVEHAITMATKALKEQDVALAQEVLDGEEEIDQKEKEIEALCLKMLLMQQPVASDLRVISSALKIITDMECIGDQAADISEIVISMNRIPFVNELVHIPKMASETVKMVSACIDAYVRKDLTLARAVIAMDDTIDEAFDKVKVDLIKLMQISAERAEQAIDLLMVAKFLERIGDHACNIANWVAFSITGTHNGAEK